MTAIYTWSEHRERLVAATGDAPSAELEQRILDVFERHPALVVAGVEHIADRYQRGLVRAPWVVLAKHVEEAAAASARASVPVRDDRDLSRARSRAQQWMRTVGLLFDTEAELRDELFGERGMLRDFASDDELASGLVALWHELRPVGERIEREAVERARRDVVARAAARDPRPSGDSGAATIVADPPRSSLPPSQHEIEALLSGTLVGRE